MKTADFTSELTPNGQITVSPEIAAQAAPGGQMQVVLQWGVAETMPHGGPWDDDSWKHRMPTTTRFTSL
jgi:hypothetical protein